MMNNTQVEMLRSHVHRYEELRAGSSGDDSVEKPHVVHLSPLHNPNSMDNSSVDDVDDGKTGTILSGYFNIANTIMGGGVLGLPYAYGHTGWLLGSILLVVCAASSAFALHTLSLCAIKLNNEEKRKARGDLSALKGASFYSVAKATLPSCTLIIDIAIALKCFGVAISYLIVTGDLMPHVMEQFGASGVWVSRRTWVFLGWLSVMPLTPLKNLNSLAPVSSLAVVFVLFFAFLVILYASGIDGLDPCADVPAGESCKGATYAVKFDYHTCKVFPIFVFGFTCHQNIFAVCNEMHNLTSRRADASILAAVGNGLVMYLILASVGYDTFGANVDPDFLTNYPDAAYTSVARIFISILVLLSYPLQCHPARRCVMTIIEQCTTAMAQRQRRGKGGRRRGAGGSVKGGAVKAMYEGVGDGSDEGHSPAERGAYCPPMPGCLDSCSDGRGQREGLESDNPLQAPLHVADSAEDALEWEEEEEEGEGDEGDCAEEVGVNEGAVVVGADAEHGVEGVPRVSTGKGRKSRKAYLDSTDVQFAVITVAFLLLTLLIAITIEDLSIVLGLVGATGSTTVSYILPGFYYYLLFKDPADGPAWKRNLALAQGIFGLIIVPVCLTFIFL